MAIPIHSSNLFIKKSTILKLLRDRPPGWGGFNPGLVEDDGQLASLFMKKDSPFFQKMWIEKELEALGLKGEESVNGFDTWKDFCFFDPAEGITTPCPWLGLDLEHRWAWLKKHTEQNNEPFVLRLNTSQIKLRLKITGYTHLQNYPSSRLNLLTGYLSFKNKDFSLVKSFRCLDVVQLSSLYQKLKNRIISPDQQSQQFGPNDSVLSWAKNRFHRYQFSIMIWIKVNRFQSDSPPIQIPLTLNKKQYRYLVRWLRGLTHRYPVRLFNPIKENQL